MEFLTGLGVGIGTGGILGFSSGVLFGILVTKLVLFDE